ncbi:MAG: hypothetical protein ACPG52_07775 [Cognaticolwellia sp.]
MIKELTSEEISAVHGGGEGAEAAGYVVGRVIGGVMYAGGVAGGALGSFGSWLGGAIYDATH